MLNEMLPGQSKCPKLALKVQPVDVMLLTVTGPGNMAQWRNMDSP